MTSFKDPAWDSVGAELWPIVAKSLGAQRLARQGRVAPTGSRDSSLEILVGDNGWVDHWENGILYSFDSTKCMFSWGNLSEKLRMARLDCRDEVIVDLFAGIGYFVLPFLVRANAKLVYACEWNPHAVEALRHNLRANSILDSCIVLEGDNRVTAPKDKSADVRKAAEVCIGEIFRVCGPDAVTKNLKDIQGPALAIVLERLKHSEAFQEAFEVAKTISMGPSLKSRSKVGKSGSKVGKSGSKVHEPDKHPPQHIS